MPSTFSRNGTPRVRSVRTSTKGSKRTSGNLRCPQSCAMALHSEAGRSPKSLDTRPRGGNMKMIWAVVRSSKVDEVAARLKSIGVSGCTVSRIRGYGDEWHVYEPLIHGGQHKLETIVRNDQVDIVVKEITNHACTRLEGDGILAVFELQSVVEIRSKERVGAETSPNGLLSRTPSRFV